MPSIERSSTWPSQIANARPLLITHIHSTSLSHPPTTSSIAHSTLVPCVGLIHNAQKEQPMHLPEVFQRCRHQMTPTTAKPLPAVEGQPHAAKRTDCLMIQTLPSKTPMTQCRKRHNHLQLRPLLVCWGWGSRCKACCWRYTLRLKARHTRARARRADQQRQRQERCWP